MNNLPILLDAQYMGSIGYYARLITHPSIFIEKYEHFVKSSFRNRAYIATPNGVLTLSIPIEGGKNIRMAMHEVKISTAYDWQRLHWQSLIAAYRSSPFFEYYEDALYPFYHKPYQYLFDFNLALTRQIVQLLKVDKILQVTDSYQKNYPAHLMADFRAVYHPSESKSHPDANYTPPVYSQVFEPQTGFLPNVSILDLLFAEGRHSLQILQQAIV